MLRSQDVPGCPTARVRNSNRPNRLRTLVRNQALRVRNHSYWPTDRTGRVLCGEQPADAETRLPAKTAARGPRGRSLGRRHKVRFGQLRLRDRICFSKSRISIPERSPISSPLRPRTGRPPTCTWPRGRSESKRPRDATRGRYRRGRRFGRRPTSSKLVLMHQARHRRHAWVAPHDLRHRGWTTVDDSGLRRRFEMGKPPRSI